MFSRYSNILVCDLCRCNSVRELTFASFFAEAKSQQVHIKSNESCVFICSGEGLGPSDIQELLLDINANINISTRVLFNAAKVDKNVGYRYRNFPDDNINHNDHFTNLEKLNTDWKNLEINRYFIVLMRRPAIDRALFAKLLLDNFEQDTFLLSCCGSTTHKIPQQIHDAIAPYKLPILLDGLVTKSKEHVHTNERFFKCFINVAVETNSQIQPGISNEIYLTEKSFKPFAFRQLPIWNAVPGTVQEVRKLGFDVYDDIINHSYDDTQDPYARMKSVSNELHRIVNLYSIRDLQKLRNTLWPRIIANVDLLRELTDKRDLKLRQLMWELIEE